MWPSEMNQSLIYWTFSAMHQVCSCWFSLTLKRMLNTQYVHFEGTGMKFRCKIVFPNSQNTRVCLDSSHVHINIFPFYNMWSPHIVDFYFYTMTSMEMFWLFLLFKCKSMASSKSSKQLCSPGSGGCEDDPRALARAPSIRAGSQQQVPW